MLMFNAERPGRTPERRRHHQGSVERLSRRRGRLLLSDMGRALMSIEADDAETHDTFCGASNQAATHARTETAPTGVRTPTPATGFCWAPPSSAWDARTCIPASTGSRTVRVAADGATQLQHRSRTAPGRSVTAASGDGGHRGPGQLPSRARPAPAVQVTPVRAIGLARTVTARQMIPIRNATPGVAARLPEYRRLLPR